MPDAQQICIEAHTLVASAHGDLLDVGMDTPRGQQVILRISTFSFKLSISLASAIEPT
jgi:hypothetical protein